MIPHERIKQMAERCAADLCGIAPVERFSGAPAGFGPRDIFPETKSVIAFARRMPDSVFEISAAVPYTHFESLILTEVDQIALGLVRELEAMGAKAIPVPSEPYEYWDKDTMTGKGILSLKHTAHLAGLGVITRNHLLTNRRFGNRIKLGAILTDIKLEPDPIDQEPKCPSNCDVCRTSCPVQAIHDGGVVQKLCRSRSGVSGKGYVIYGCWACRGKCPNSKGKRA